MIGCVIHTPPERKHHLVAYGTDRVLLCGSAQSWKQDFLQAVTYHPITILNSQGNVDWEIEHSFISTLIPLAFLHDEDASMLSVLGRHLSTGKVIPVCSPTFKHADVVRGMCEFDGITLYKNPDDLIKVLIKRLNIPTEIVDVDVVK